MSAPEAPLPRGEQHTDPPTEADGGALHPEDAAWMARRSASAPMVLGLLSVALSPILLGLFFGPLSLRAGIDLYRRGTRGAATVVAIGTGLVGVILSITMALVWGSILASVLLGRDAMRAAEGWRGQQVRTSMFDALVAGDARAIDLAKPVDGAARHAVLVIGVGFEPCALAIRGISEVADRYPDVPVVIVDREASTEDVRAFARQHGTASVERFFFIGRASALPAPLDQAAALPTLVVIGGNSAVEHAIVGAHPAVDIEKLIRGDAALPAEPPAAGTR